MCDLRRCSALLPSRFTLDCQLDPWREKAKKIAALEMTASKAQAALSKLDDDCLELSKKEAKLVALLSKAQKEEAGALATGTH